MHNAKYQGYITLEYKAAEDLWKAVPDALKKCGRCSTPEP
jgi:hypothetical protein